MNKNIISVKTENSNCPLIDRINKIVYNNMNCYAHEEYIMRNSWKKITMSFLLLAVLLVSCGCGDSDQGALAAGNEKQNFFQQEMFSQQRFESGEGKVIISEVMSKNKTNLQDASGEFPDWIEIENISDEDLNLSGWSLSDGKNKEGWPFPDFTLYARSRAIIFASNKAKGGEGELHASFAVSEGETVCLRDKNGEIVSAAEIGNDKADRSYIPGKDGTFVETKYPTPGLENTREAFVALQRQKAVRGPVIVNEVCVDGSPDWVEIKNISAEDADLSQYYLSENEDELKMYQFPQVILHPGEMIVIDCTSDTKNYQGFRYLAPFSISSDNDRLYISDDGGNIIDCLALMDIPTGCSYGRMDGENGGFYFAEKSPGHSNEGGKRYILHEPVPAQKDGIFENVSAVPVELSGEGEIYYTTDGSRPTAGSTRYTGPFSVEKSCTVRAICIGADGMDSHPITLNYIINQGHKLPVACLSTDSLLDFNTMYMNKIKDYEIPGNISYYDENGNSFSINCGIKMNGFSTLEWAKKNMSLRFRGQYGQDTLNYDLFGGGVTEFSNLLLRGGGDQLNTIVRSEACSNLCMQFTDKVPSQRSRYCALYINGYYYGIYSLMEKANEAHYATWAGVSRGSVTVNDATVEAYDEMYLDVIGYILTEDMSVPENYKYVCEHLDIDSFIDWCVFEGWTGNDDLASGNLRYAMSPENGGKWMCMLFDLDAAFGNSANCMMTVTNFWNQVTLMNAELFKNAEYKDKFLSRLAEALSTTLTEENFLAEVDRLCSEIDSEVERDSTVSGMSYSSWRGHVDMLKNNVNNGWNRTCIENICEILELTPEERTHYFGELN